jgi:lipopolysaccharide/colanic/teichoic acid biosynthesis glycosyltransferase
MLSLERKRTERSNIPFLLVLLNIERLRVVNGDRDHTARQIMAAVSPLTRETDLVGWYKTGDVVGILFTQMIAVSDPNLIVNPILAKVVPALNSHLPPAKATRIAISWHVFPEIPGDDSGIPSDTELYPDVVNRNKANRVLRIAKRLIDILGSIVALLLFSPFYGIIALLVKLSSEGPVIFTQERLGQFGNTFRCLKFRTMYANNDPKIHQEFMKQVIKGQYDGNAGNGSKPVYKMTNDPRITCIGRFLRRTSLDEFPQFINVLKGDMSLVGPRPPLAYEYLQYDTWQRRRVIESKPGITGLWQVRGRSRVRFDDMVRLDLQYGSAWSLWLDMQILMQTPRAVLLGDDAF